MKNILLIASLLTFSFFSIFGQSPNKEQEKIATKFCLRFLEREYDYCWKNFDKEMNPTITRHAFDQAMDQMHAILPSDSKKIELFMNGVKMIENNTAPFYSFKYADDVSKPAGFLLDVLFSSSKSKLVAGFQPKGKMEGTNSAASSKGKETVISSKEIINIDNQEYTIKGINIVHFKDNEGVVAIQIEQNIPTEKNQNDLEEWAKTEGIKFAKWLYKSEQYQKAQTEAKNLNLTLISNIGVSFIIPSSGNGYNVMIEEKDYK